MNFVSPKMERFARKQRRSWGLVRLQVWEASALWQAYSGRISLWVALQLVAWRSRARQSKERAAAAALGRMWLHWRAQRRWRITQTMLRLRRLILQARALAILYGDSDAASRSTGTTRRVGGVVPTLSIRRSASGSTQAAGGAPSATVTIGSVVAALGAVCAGSVIADTAHGAPARDGWTSLPGQLGQVSLQLQTAMKRWAVRVPGDRREDSADGPHIRRVALRLQLAALLWRAWERQERQARTGALWQEGLYSGEERQGASVHIATLRQDGLYRRKGRRGHGGGADCLPCFHAEVRLRVEQTLDAPTAGLTVQRYARGWLSRRVYVAPRLRLHVGREHAGALAGMLVLAHRTYPSPHPRAAPVVHHLFVYEAESGLALGAQVRYARHARPLMTAEWYCQLTRLRVTCAAVHSAPTAPHSRLQPAVLLYDTKGGGAAQPDPSACLCAMPREA